MKRALQIAIRLYPRAWRRRYEREFTALVDEVGGDWRCFCDVLMGAVIMRLQTGVFVVVTCACVGATAGALWSQTTPAVYAATATVRLPRASDARGEMRVAIEQALRSSGLAPQHTSVVVGASTSADSLVRVSYAATSAAEAQRAAQQLAQLLTTATSASLVEPAAVPNEARRESMWPAAAVGAAIGLLAGAAIFVIRLRHVQSA